MSVRWLGAASPGGYYPDAKATVGEDKAMATENIVGTAPGTQQGSASAEQPTEKDTKIVRTFTDGNFDEVVLKSSAPVLVDFWAEWCGPCKRLGPTVDALAGEYAGKLTVGKLNVDENPNVAFKFQIRGIPTLLIFKSGTVVESIVGLASKDDLKKTIDKHI
jgi:thioredoxin 1